MIKFIIPSKENDKQIKTKLRTSIYCKICLVVYMVQDELRKNCTGIIHNDLIMQQEDIDSYCLCGSIMGCSLAITTLGVAG